MIRSGKQNLLGLSIDVIDYDGAVEAVSDAARRHEPFAATALAVHGLMTGVLDQEQRFRLNSFDLVVPDGQPIRWALNWLFKAALKDRVYGPNLTLAICERVERDGLPLFFYGSTTEVLAKMQRNLLDRFPRLQIAGLAPSKFRRISLEEKHQLLEQIRASGAAIVFVGLGCPRQEIWAYEFRESLQRPILAVGAAFPFLAGTLSQAPRWMQDKGLEWLYRFAMEPLRLWKRYLLLNPLFLGLLGMQRIGILRFRNPGKRPTREVLFG